MTGFESKRQAALDKLVELTEELRLYDKPVTKDQALQIALDALESKYLVACGAWWVQQDQAIAAVKAALAQLKEKNNGSR